MNSIGDILVELKGVIEDRAVNPREGSYTTYLLTQGLDKICKKIGEESTEVVIAAKNGAHDELVYEISDLFYHVLVLMTHSGISLADIATELKRRRQ
ncbi:MAG: phosphoribosyl-ATP diphosphatase [Clostridiaceae bacterium]|nr:phosphoribosyl-ATP diphosphatase [Clostridiaceae bacterium]